jgi:hypothetical protein
MRSHLPAPYYHPNPLEKPANYFTTWDLQTPDGKITTVYTEKYILVGEPIRTRGTRYTVIYVGKHPGRKSNIVILKHTLRDKVMTWWWSVKQRLNN